MLKDQHENIYIEFSMLGVNLLLILFILFLIIRTKKSSLVFLLFFGICAVSNHLLYNEMIIYYIFPDLTYEIIIKLTSLTYFMGGSLILALVGFQYKSETCKPIVYISIVYSFFVFNHIFFQDFYFFENFPFVNQTKIYSLIFIIVGQIQYAYAVFILVWARKHKRQGAGYYLLCLLLFWLVTLLVFFKYYNLCKISLINLALLFFIFAIVFYHYRAQFKPSATDDVSQLVDFRADEGKKKFLAQFPLSMQEQRIMYLILDKQSSREIASSLQLSVRTVENYTYRIFRKCSIKSRVELLALFYTHSALAPSLDREKGRALGSPAGMPVTNKRKKFPHPL
ncbi:MAG: helix-turn-helix transcriptional regulator [Spirochaetales bacterium]|nr:helix-turn-helix transcriptional regulator [Spirochaetales bacterium]